MGALFATNCLLRLDLEGRHIFSFGVDACGCARREPQDHHEEKRVLHSKMNWLAITDLVVRTDPLRLDACEKIVLRHERVAGMLVLGAIHDVEMNTALIPTVLPHTSPHQ